MHARTHLVVSAAVGMLCYPRRPLQALLTTLAGVLIDIDHYVLYGIRSGDWSLVGALRYEQRRHGRRRPGDTRPRYGSLRSVAHNAWLTLPLAWLTAWAWPVARPIAIGLSVHLALDLYLPHYDWRAWRRAAGRCERCQRLGLKREVYYHLPPNRGGQHWALANRMVWCDDCARAVFQDDESG